MKYLVSILFLVFSLLGEAQNKNVRVSNLDSTNFQDFMSYSRNTSKKLTKKLEKMSSQEVTDLIGHPNFMQTDSTKTKYYYRLRTSITDYSINTSKVIVVFDAADTFLEIDYTWMSARRM